MTQKFVGFTDLGFVSYALCFHQVACADNLYGSCEMWLQYLSEVILMLRYQCEQPSPKVTEYS